eukprot:CAMPEP_0180414984 /NCGR_PEP_ID=MMETSP0989-20121125/45953_1 /TAXON_ID=697907 /ORGANISM="non described non described, Strain CCMP2293" /LENGTH=102 /DNA_ID=CAMNT_0022419729 /DNA_START=300 /DNA_END=608 /DNA_ORIENTATION=-
MRWKLMRAKKMGAYISVRQTSKGAPRGTCSRSRRELPMPRAVAKEGDVALGWKAEAAAHRGPVWRAVTRLDCEARAVIPEKIQRLDNVPGPDVPALGRVDLI